MRGDTMRILTTGTSKITKTLVKAFQTCGIETYAACGRDLEKTEKFCLDNGIARAYDNYDKALDDKNVDAVYVGVPNSLHYIYALKAILKHKHVILEKPFTSNLNEAMDLVKKAIDNDVILFEAILPIHLPAYQKMKEEIKNIGKLTCAELNFSKYSSKYDAFKRGEKPNVFTKEFAGGALVDLNVYNLYYAIDLFGLPNKYHYICNIKGDVDVSGTFILTYDNHYVVGTALKDSNAHNFVSISGEEGDIYYEGAPSLIDNFVMHTKNSGTITYDYPFDDAYVYEVNVFKELVEKHDTKLMKYYLRKTLEVMSALDNLKSSASL